MLVYLFELGFQGTAFYRARRSRAQLALFVGVVPPLGGSTNQLVVVDTSPFHDEEAANKQLLVLRNRDANASFNVELTAKLARECENLGITYCYKDEYIEAQNKFNKSRVCPKIRW